MKQQQANKPAAKPAAKQANKPATLFYKGLLAACLAGKFGAEIQRFYVNAIAYHTKQKTTFPRARIAAVELLKPNDATSFIEKHKTTSIPAGSKTAQRLFDQMMIEAKQAK